MSLSITLLKLMMAAPTPLAHRLTDSSLYERSMVKNYQLYTRGVRHCVKSCTPAFEILYAKLQSVGPLDFIPSSS